MKSFLDSVILWELIFLFWMSLTLGNRLMNFTGSGPFVPTLEQLMPAPKPES